MEDLNKNKDCCCCRRNSVRIAVVLLGGFIIHLALGALYTFGNFAPYIISYLRNRTDDTEIRNVDSLWIQASGSVGNCLGLIVGGINAHRFGTRVAIFMGSLVFCGSVAASYFSVNRSFIALVFSYGLTRYFGHKLTYGAPVQTAIRWLPRHATFAAGVIVSGTGGGSLIFNQIITGYINPNNLSPDLVTGDDERYFTQPDLLDRVPTCFLILGATYFVLQLIGNACVSEPPTGCRKEIRVFTSKTDLKDIDTKEDIIFARETKFVTDKGDTLKQNNGDNSLDGYCNEAFQDSEGLKPLSDANEPSMSGVKTVDIDSSAPYPRKDILDNQIQTKDTAIQETPEKEIESSSIKELGILEAVKFSLKCRSFYIVWCTMMCMNGGFQFINSLYKAYGLTFIDDDHFLALVGSLGAIFNCIGRPVWGAVMDKTSFRVAIRCVSGGFVICTATLLLTEHLPKYLFLVWICALYFFFCGIWSIMPSTIAKLLGPQHMAINYGIIYSGLSVVSILGSFFGTSLKSEIGWHGLFFMASGLGSLVFVVSFFFNGVDRNGKPI